MLRSPLAVAELPDPAENANVFAGKIPALLKLT
jgi:hypothetical protein